MESNRIMGIEKYTNKGNLLQQFAEKIKGKLVLVWGPSLSGKTTFVLNVSRYFNKPLYFRIDKNLSYDQIKEYSSSIEIVDVNTYDQLLLELKKEDIKDYDLLIVDSLTGLNESLMQVYKPPKLYNEIANSQSLIMYKLASFKPNITSIVVTHSRIEDFEKRTVGPSINNKVLKYVDLAYKVIRNDEGVSIKKWLERKAIKVDDYNIEL